MEQQKISVLSDSCLTTLEVSKETNIGFLKKFKNKDQKSTINLDGYTLLGYVASVQNMINQPAAVFEK